MTLHPEETATGRARAAARMRAVTPRPACAGAGIVMAAALLLAGCSGFGPPQALPAYQCEHGIRFTAKFVDDSVLLESSRGADVLYRDAGGLTPQQQVFSNPRMRAEFGLGASGREAILRYPLLPLVARCVRD
jgi:hypothetical protein